MVVVDPVPTDDSVVISVPGMIVVVDPVAGGSVVVDPVPTDAVVEVSVPCPIVVVEPVPTDAVVMMSVSRNVGCGGSCHRLNCGCGSCCDRCSCGSVCFWQYRCR